MEPVPLVKDGNEGRPNPFAPIGNDALSSTAIATPTQEAPELNIKSNHYSNKYHKYKQYKSK